MCGEEQGGGGGVRLGEWERLLDDSDDARVWRAINWKGELVATSDSADRPSDEEFKVHTYIEPVLNPKPVPAPPPARRRPCNNSCLR